MATVSLHTFTCDTCGKEESLQFANDEPKHMPEGWIVKRLRQEKQTGRKADEFSIPAAYHYCSVDCKNGNPVKEKKSKAKDKEPEAVPPVTE